MAGYPRFGQPNAGTGFNPYAAGAKRYGPSGRRAPNIGAIRDRSGYAERDAKIKARRNALLKTMQAQQGGRYNSPEVLRPRVRKGF